jgi:hypothetical protein
MTIVVLAPIVVMIFMTYNFMYRHLKNLGWILPKVRPRKDIARCYVVIGAMVILNSVLNNVTISCILLDA